jgi:hypothetical protein
MEQIFASTSELRKGDLDLPARPMTDAELLHHYIERNRIIHGGERTAGHYRLRDLGFIEEHPVSVKNLLITVTAAGRTAIDSRPAEYVGLHPTLWGLTPP